MNVDHLMLSVTGFISVGGYHFHWDTPLWSPCGLPGPMAGSGNTNMKLKEVRVLKELTVLQGRKAFQQNIVVEAGIEKCTRHNSVIKVDYRVDY